MTSPSKPNVTRAVDPRIVELPKVELHLHLEGSMTPHTIGRLAAEQGADLTGIWPEGLPERFSFVDFPDFAQQFQFGLRLLRRDGALESAVVALARDLALQRVRYAEVTSTVFTHLSAGMSAASYRDALNEGRRRAWNEHGVLLAWVIDIPRDLEMPDSTVTIEFLESAFVPDNTIGIGLGGYEVGFPPEPYAPHFARARALGLRSLPHAGETEGAASIRGALDELGAERIGHGVRCLEDPELVARLCADGIMLEVCPTSNVLLHVAPSFEDHPLPALLAAGLQLCINTDDPGWFATDLSTELQITRDVFGLDLEDLRALQLRALDASSLTRTERARVADEIAAYSFMP
jgi:adenosine deaminase